MSNLKSILVLAFLSVIFISCNENESNEIVLEPVIATKIENLHAPQVGNQGRSPVSGEFTKFSFKEGTQVSGDNWDIAFRGTTILVNGGSKIGLTDEPERTGNAALTIENGTFSSIIEAPENANFKQDANETYALPTGAGNGWYSYNPQLNQINPIAGKVIVVKTTDGNYAKMEIISYYKDLDAANPAKGRYYTFNYSYNPNAGEKSFE